MKSLFSNLSYRYKFKLEDRVKWGDHNWEHGVISGVLDWGIASQWRNSEKKKFGFSTLGYDGEAVYKVRTKVGVLLIAESDLELDD